MNEVDQIVSYYRLELKKSPEAVAYLQKRQLNAEAINHFRIGYAPNEPIHNHIFQNRIMFPIKNTSGEYIAFTGRSINGEDPKYKNSWETAEYQKKRILFGYSDALPYIKAKESVVVVEGQSDAIRLWMNGVYNVVASSGTSFSPAHACILARYAKTAYLLFDSDKAGRDAALECRVSLENVDMQVKIGNLPVGYDPDTFVLHYGINALKKLFIK